MLPTPLKHGFSLSTYTAADKPSLIRSVNDPDIYKTTLKIPHPYGDAEADTWLSLVEAWTKANHGVSTSFCIRNPNGKVVGGIGFDGLEIGNTHRAEVGYWLAKPYWGKGIISAALAETCKLGFEQFQLEKITAHIFAFNTASQRVLEKNGFHLEGEMMRHYKKDWEFFNARLYAKLK